MDETAGGAAARDGGSDAAVAAAAAASAAVAVVKTARVSAMADGKRGGAAAGDRTPCVPSRKGHHDHEG